MAPSRRQNNGRSPLVNPQRQITSFFCKSTSPSPSPNLSNPNPNPKSKPKSKSTPNSSPSPSPSPNTPSPLQSKPKKTLLVIGQTPSPPPSTPTTTAARSYGEEVVHKRIRVYWPLDKSWYEGVVKSLDKESNKHMVQYDDGEEELLDFGKEKIELIEETAKRFKRLRRGSSVLKRMVIEDEKMENVVDKSGNDEDDSSDEDWGSKNVDKDSEEEEDMDLEDEEDDKVSKQKKGVKGESRKRKASTGGNFGSGKKNKSGGPVGKGGVKVSEPVKNSESK